MRQIRFFQEEKVKCREVPMQNIDRIQETAYQLILEFLTGEEKPIPRFDLNDETALLNLLYNRKVLFALSPLLEKKLSAPSVTKMKVLTAHHKNVIRKRLSIAKEVMDTAIENRIPCVFIKGMALSRLIYEDIYIRPGNDLDFWTGPEYALPLAEILLQKDFYISGRPDPKTGKAEKIKKPVMIPGSYYYEYTVEKEVDGFSIKAEIKKLSSALLFLKNSPYRENMLQYTEEIDLEGNRFVTSDLEYTLLHLCANTYVNTESEFGVLHSHHWIDYMDLYLFLKKYQNALDWKKVKEHGENLGITHRIYKTFNDVKELFGFPMDESIIGQFTFNPENVTHERVFPSGSLTDWKMSIKERFFYPKERIIEYYKGIRAEKFRQEYVEKSTYRVETIDDNPPFLRMADEAGIDYADLRIYKDDKGLYFHLDLAEVVKKNPTDYQVLLSLFNNDMESDVYQTVIRTHYDSNGIYADLEDHKHKTTDALTAVQKDDSILLHIPFDSIIGWKKRLLAFSIYFFKKIENGAYDYTAGVIKSDLEKAKYIRF
jgi:hypothetical protein